MLVKRFGNGNFNIKMEKDDFDIKESTLVKVIWALYDHDCSLFGEEYCLSNYEMAVDLYCYYNGMVVTLPYSILDDLEKGKTVKLYAHKMSEYELEVYNDLVESGEL